MLLREQKQKPAQSTLFVLGLLLLLRAALLGLLAAHTVPATSKILSTKPGFRMTFSW